MSTDGITCTDVVVTTVACTWFIFVGGKCLTKEGGRERERGGAKSLTKEMRKGGGGWLIGATVELKPLGCSLLTTQQSLLPDEPPSVEKGLFVLTLVPPVHHRTVQHCRNEIIANPLHLRNK